tara:strand:+ start:7529 stop:9211 length:1683 start_codon:yes stop_codon:yes gene_type:complete
LSYLVLARKYRPSTFKEVVGQEHITKTLINAFKKGRLSHAYLFSGPRGVGKTSTARILAKSFNCKNNQSGEPCNECVNCKEITNGSNLDVLEIDGASNRGVDEIRNLREVVKYPPINSNFKIIIIDEIHMLTQIAFNALLKTLEEPPQHVKFIFATTEPNKILQTIISRCQRYDFNRVGINDIEKSLENISLLEKVKVEKSVYSIIANLADGSMRDCLSIFDQLIAFSDGEITNELAIKMLGVIPTDLFFNITDSLHLKNKDNILLILNDVFNKGFKLNELLSGLNKHILNLLCSKLENYKQILSFPEEMKERYFENSKKWEYLDLLKISDQISKMEVNFKIVNNPKIFIELNLLKLIEMDNSPKIKEILSQVNSNSDKHDEINQKKDILTDKNPIETENKNTSFANIKNQIVDTSNVKDYDITKKNEFKIQNLESDENEKDVENLTSEDKLNIDKILEVWPKVNMDIENESKSIAAFLLHSKPHIIEDNILKISLPKKYSFQIDVLNNNKNKILSIMKKHIDISFTIEFILDDNSNFDDNKISPVTKKMIDKFGGEIAE